MSGRAALVLAATSTLLGACSGAADEEGAPAAVRFREKDLLVTPADERDAQRAGDRFIYVADLGTGPALYSLADGSDIPDRLSQEGLRVATPRVSPDGSRVLYVGASRADEERVSGGAHDLRRLRLDADTLPDSVETRIWIVPARGGDPNPLTAAGEQSLDPMWLPAGGTFLYARGREGVTDGFDIYKTDLVGGEPTLVYGGPGDQRQPALRPGSGHLLFRNVAGEEGALMLGDLDRSKPTQVAPDLRDPSHPAWSPDGKWVAVDEHSPRGRVVRILEAEQRRLKAADGDPPLGASPAWMNERAVLVTRYDPAALEWIWLNQEDKPPHSILRDPLHDLTQPAISPQRTLVLYRCNGDLEVADIRPERTERRRVTDDQWEDADPVWSPGGLSFAFSSRREGNLDIYLRTFPGLRERRLTTDPADDRTPNFTPDGRNLLFASNRNGTTGLYSLEIEEAESEPLLLDAGRDGNPLYPSLSKGLDWIVYSIQWGESPGIEMFNLETGEQRPLTLGSDPLTADTAPTFSPDGVYIAFQRTDPANSELYLAPMRGGSPRLLESRAGKARRGPDWMSDGHSLVYSVGGSYDIALIELAGLW